MMNKSTKVKFLSLVLAASGFMLVSGNSAEVSAQRDPFAKTQPAAPRTGGAKTSAAAKPEKPKPTVPVPVGAPAIQDRIAYYKRMREAAALQNQPIPKVTSVLTLDEMSVVGIFRTPRGYAAMVEAKPIKLSYTIYPGEKFFDGQLVAIEENKLVFRKVTKMSNGKFIAAEENKALRQYTVEQEVQGTAPIEASGKTETAANSNSAPAANSATTVTDDKMKANVPSVISSPLEEMNKQAAELPKDSAKSKLANKKGKSTVSEKKTEKVAKNKDQ
jgi:hypothetical protein